MEQPQAEMGESQLVARLRYFYVEVAFLHLKLKILSVSVMMHD